MKPKKRQKLCYNCEGEIDLDVIVCPFCAADLREEKPEQQYPAYNPANSVKNMGSPGYSQATKSLYPPSQSSEKPPLKLQDEVVVEEVISSAEKSFEEKEKHIFGPTILFALGVLLFLFGLIMLLFSHKGMLVLKWDARQWFLYVFASIPFLIFGYRALSKL
jgi:hypothetical protein